MVTRRQLITSSMAGGAVLLTQAAIMWPAETANHRVLPARRRARPAPGAPVPGGTLDPARVPKYVVPLFVLPAMPQGRASSAVDYHEIGVRQFAQRVLPPGYPTTPVFGYG